MKKFYSPEYGFLHACKKDGSLWYNLTDLCQTLSMLLREAEALVRTTRGQIREFNVRRQKITSCNRYIDQDGLLTLLRQWILQVDRWCGNTFSEQSVGLAGVGRNSS